MRGEELINQIGNFVIWKKYEIEQSLSRSVKELRTDGDYEGMSDEYGLGKHQFNDYVMNISQLIIDSETGNAFPNEDDARDWDLSLSQLMGGGLQPVIFSCLQDAQPWSYPQPIFKYQYAYVKSLDPEYQKVMRKWKYSLQFDRPCFFEIPVNSVVFIPYNNAPPTQKRWNSSRKWTQGHRWSTLIQAYIPWGFPEFLLKILHGNSSFTPSGYLVLFDEFFFTTFRPPNFLVNGFTRSIASSEFYPSAYGFETTITINNVPFDGSLDNHCYIIKIEKTILYGDYIEIINTVNGSGIRFESNKTSSMTNLIYYNLQNQNIYDEYGIQLNTDNLDVSISIPNQAKTWLYFDKTLKSTADKIGQYPPSLKIISNNNTALTFRLKNQRMYI